MLPPKPGIVVAGEALIDLAPTTVEGEYRAHPGGGPANAAVALARLGAHVVFLGRLSEDTFGDQLADWLTGNGVDLSLAVRVDDPTTVAVATVGADGGASYSFYWQGTANWQWVPHELPEHLPEGTEALHIGSLATLLEPGAELLDRLLRRNADHVTTFVDPNFRPQLDNPNAASSRLSRWLVVCDIVKVSVDDVAYIHPDVDPISLARGWADRNGNLVLLTDGPRGAYAFMDGVQLRSNADARTVVDTIGAGDGFGAAFLYALHAQHVLAKGSSRPVEAVQAALDLACAAAAVICERAGADSPRLDELPVDVVRAVESGMTSNDGHHLPTTNPATSTR